MAVVAGDAHVGVVGAGTMGSGIAYVAAKHGHQVVLGDANPDAVSRAKSGHERQVERDVAKGRLSADAGKALAESIRYTVADDMSAFAACTIVIEAVVERLDVKRAIFSALERVVGPDAILATNTSSLSVTAIAGACTDPSRVIGVHFFNPAPVMQLVEIIPSLVTAPALVASVRELINGWGKTTVVASDTPGFIVNRIARPFYGEALRILEEGVADVATIDWAMRDESGFPMGPFELMDLVGNDVNYAVTCSVFESMFHDPRYRPSHIQRSLVGAGLLGRKSGRGYYNYSAATRPEPLRDKALGQKISRRILAMLVNEAVDARFLSVASAQDIETAMTKGVNYPRGLLAWGDEIGAAAVLETLDSLFAEYHDSRYRASALLRRAVASGASLRS